MVKASFYSINLKQALPAAADQTLTAFRRNSGPVFLQSCFHSDILLGWPGCELIMLWWLISISTGLRSFYSCTTELLLGFRRWIHPDIILWDIQGNKHRNYYSPFWCRAGWYFHVAMWGPFSISPPKHFQAVKVLFGKLQACIWAFFVLPRNHASMNYASYARLLRRDVNQLQRGHNEAKWLNYPLRKYQAAKGFVLWIESTVHVGLQCVIPQMCGCQQRTVI